jgi:hypothetical protein
MLIIIKADEKFKRRHNMPCPEKFKESLTIFGVNEIIINNINDGYNDLVSSSDKRKCSTYFIRAMKILDREVAHETKYKIMDYNACCKGGKMDKNVKEHAKKTKGLDLENKIKSMIEVPGYMGSPKLRKDGTIEAGLYDKEGEIYKCGCSTFRKNKVTDLNVSLTYCLCCAGHFRYHYENGFGIKLRTKEVVSSAINSSGKKPCVFIYEQEK